MHDFLRILTNCFKDPNVKFDYKGNTLEKHTNQKLNWMKFKKMENDGKTTVLQYIEEGLQKEKENAEYQKIILQKIFANPTIGAHYDRIQQDLISTDAFLGNSKKKENITATQRSNLGKVCKKQSTKMMVAVAFADGINICFKIQFDYLLHTSTSIRVFFSF